LNKTDRLFAKQILLFKQKHRHMVQYARASDYDANHVLSAK
jgi:hypothetical protein